MKPTPRDVRWLVDQLDDQKRRLQNLENRKPGLAYSSIEDGAIREYDKDGTLGSQTGKQPDGTHGNVVYNGPPPPTPTLAKVAAVPGVVEVRWNGKFADDAVSPLDFKHVAAYVVPVGAPVDFAAQAGVMTGELGDALQVQVDAGVYDVYLASWSKAGRRSELAGPVAVAVPVAADVDAIQAALDDLDVRYDGVITEAGNLGNRLDTAETDISAAEIRLDEAGTRLDTVFGEVAAIPGAISTAKQQAITVAASDAQTKADAALTAANAAVEALAANAGNMASYGDNESFEGQWFPYNAVEARSGNRAFTATISATTQQAYTLPDVPVVGGNWYKVGFWIKATANFGISSGMPIVLVRADGSQYNSSAQYPAIYRAEDRGTLTPNVWQHVTALWQIPSDDGSGVPITKMRPRYYVWNGAADAGVTVRMDDFTAQDVTAAKGAIDAAAAAQAVATAAQAAAGNAQATATSALTMAGTKSKVYYDTSAPSGSGMGAGDLWRRRGGAGGQEIIGEWQWSGSAWVSQTVSGSIVSNMDVGFLTAGAATMSQALVDKLVAGTASFQTVDVRNLFVTTGTMAEAVINKLFTDVVMSRKITTQMLAVGAFDNLVVDPDFTDTTLRAQRLAASLGMTSGFGTSADNGRAHVIIPVSTGALGFKMIATEPGRGAPVAPGATYRIRYQARTASGTAGTRPAVTCYKADGTSAFTAADNGAYVTVDTSWQWVDYTWTAPDDAASAFFDVQRQANLTGILWARTPQVTRMNAGELVVDGSITAASLAARAVTTDKLDATAVDGMVITGAIIQSPGSGAGYQLTEGGYTARDASGNVTVRLPTNGDPNQFKGDIEAQSLTVSGRASLQSANNEIASGATLVLEAGTTPPLTPPTVGSAYTMTELPRTGDSDGRNTNGLARAANLWWRASLSGGALLLHGINDTGGIARTITTGMTGSNGITAIGPELFVLGRWEGDSGPRSVAVYNASTGAYLRRWDYSQYGSGTYQPAIGTNGTDIYVAQSDANGKVIWRSFNKTTGALTVLTESTHIMKSDMVGIYRGVADFGVDRVAVTKANGTTEVYNNAGVHQPYVGWYPANGRAAQGLAWADGKFWQLQADTLVGYSNIVSPSGSGVADTDDWWIAATWRGAGGVETTMGPPQRFTFLRRSELQLAAGTLPGGVTGVRFYLARKVTIPARTDLHLLATVTGPTGRVSSLPANWATLASPPTVNTFSAASPGLIRSRADNFQVDGAGAGKWGPLTFHPDGTMTSNAVPEWIPITSFLNGCTVGDFGFVPSYRAWPDGKVELRGIIKGTLDVIKTIFSLPSAVRSAHPVNLAAATSGGGTSPAIMRVEIGSLATPDAMNVQPQGTARSWVSLDGLYYYQV